LEELRTYALDLKSGRDMRTELQTLLLERVASFQGAGSKPFAVDTPRLIDVLSGDLPTGAVPEGLPEEISLFIPTMSEARLEVRIRPLIEKLQAFQKDISAFVDDSLDKNAFVADLRGIIPLLQRTNCWPTGSPIKVGEFETSLSEFQMSRFVALVDMAASVVKDADTKQMPRLLNALGMIDIGLIERTMSFLKIVDEIISQAERNVALQETVRGQSDPSAAAASILTLLESVSEPVGAGRMEDVP
jgi:hypothetical protein